jgi:hypothetical protein
VISIFIGASPFFLDVLVNTLVKEKRLFFDQFQIHTREFTLPISLSPLFFPCASHASHLIHKKLSC